MKKKLLIFSFILDLIFLLTLIPRFFPQQEAKPFDGCKALVIGDSLTYAGEWQKVLEEDLGMEVTTHAKGGVSLIHMVDGELGLSGDYTASPSSLKPLSMKDVKEQDFILLYGGYNNRGRLTGSVGDCYSPDGTGQGSFAGVMQYAVNRIQELLIAAGNRDCKIMIVTMDCVGKYGWIDADAFDEYPLGSGQTLQDLVDIQIAVAEHNGLEYCDLYRWSGINQNTWHLYSKDAESVKDQWSVYELDSQGNAVSTVRQTYEKGLSYYQIRNGKVVLEEYQGNVPYPYNGDQVHKNALGYQKIGKTIADRMLEVYGS